MKSSNITCKATNCAHNKQCHCMAGVIVVKGKDSESVSETICNTFVEEGGYAFENLSCLYDDKETKPENIKCSAVKCKYNRDEKCFADEVEILAARAACGTFDKE